MSKSIKNEEATNQMQLTEAEIKTLSEKASQYDALTLKLTAVETQLKAATATIMASEAETAVSKAIADKKILPKMKAWATTLYLSDKAQFTGFIAMAETTGPVLGEKGTLEQPGDMTLSETEIKVAEQMNGHPLTGEERASLIKAKAGGLVPISKDK
jgi:endonuclease/exonuclease/phosphatase (EEP) superfamily protein YafD